MQNTLYAGLSGLVLPVPNKAAFPEEYRSGSRLHYYGSLYNSIEVNSSFYKIPLAATFAKWQQEVPEDFRFTVKLWRGITHEKELHYRPADVQKFMQSANETGVKKGCLLIQFPASITSFYADKIQALLAQISQYQPAHPWQLAVEFRSTTWYTGETYAWLNDFNAAVVLHDMPNSRIQQPPTNAPFVYLRYHGTAGDYKGSYTQRQLQTDAQHIRQWQQQHKTVYVYFNNTLGDATGNLVSLRKLAESR